MKKTIFLLLLSLTLTACFGETPDSDIAKDVPPPPVCRNDSGITKQKPGWYRGTEMIASDRDCTDGNSPVCLRVGSAQEGWYRQDPLKLVEKQECVTGQEFAMYFVREELALRDCEIVSPTKIILGSDAVGDNVYERALNILLQGPPADQSEFETYIPTGTKLLGVRKEGKKLIANFSAELTEGDDFCVKLRRRAQVEKTLRYIPIRTLDQIEEIVIQIEGREWTIGNS